MPLFTSKKKLEEIIKIVANKREPPVTCVFVKKVQTRMFNLSILWSGLEEFPLFMTQQLLSCSDN